MRLSPDSTKPDNTKTRRAVFFDRDGVLNEAFVRNGTSYPPLTLSELHIYADAPSACADLKRVGFILIVVTNQPDVARGTQKREIVEAINSEISRSLDVDDFNVCYHDDSNNCHCRKPKPGLILASASKWAVDLQRSFLVGDRWRDIDAGVAAGCRTIFIDRGYAERKPTHQEFTAISLKEAADWIVKQGQK